MVNKTKPKIPSCISTVNLMDIDEMIKIISKADTWWKNDLKEGCGDRTILFTDVFHVNNQNADPL